MRGPPKDHFAKDFVGEQWKIMKQPVENEIRATPEINSEGESESDNTDVHPVIVETKSQGEMIQELEDRIRILQRENDNMLLAMRVQGTPIEAVESADEEIRLLENKEFVEDLIHTKEVNARMRLELDVLADHVNSEAKKQDESVKSLAGNGRREKDLFQEHFPPLGRQNI